MPQGLSEVEWKGQVPRKGQQHGESRPSAALFQRKPSLKPGITGVAVGEGNAFLKRMRQERQALGAGHWALLRKGKENKAGGN